MMVNLASVWLKANESRREDSKAFSINYKLTSIAKKCSRRRFEDYSCLAFVRLHIVHLGALGGESRNDCARHLFRHVYNHLFIRLIAILHDDMRLRNLQFKAFASHIL